jgi:hypothetical protein
VTGVSPRWITPWNGARPPVAGDQATVRHAAFARYVLPEIDLPLRVAMALTHRSADAEDIVLGEAFDHIVAQALDDLPEAFGTVVRLVDLNGPDLRRGRQGGGGGAACRPGHGPLERGGRR